MAIWKVEGRRRRRMWDFVFCSCVYEIGDGGECLTTKWLTFNLINSFSPKLILPLPAVQTVIRTQLQYHRTFFDNSPSVLQNSHFSVHLIFAFHSFFFSQGLSCGLCVTLRTLERSYHLHLTSFYVAWSKPRSHTCTSKSTLSHKPLP